MAKKEKTKTAPAELIPEQEKTEISPDELASEQEKSQPAPVELTPEQEKAAAQKRQQEWLNEKVSIKLFKDADKYKDDVAVGVNGVIWQIKRGEWVEIPRYVAQVIENSEIQDTSTAKLMDGLQDEYTAEAQARNI